jgi:hypothetical protein
MLRPCSTTEKRRSRKSESRRHGAETAPYQSVGRSARFRARAQSTCSAAVRCGFQAPTNPLSKVEAWSWAIRNGCRY